VRKKRQSAGGGDEAGKETFPDPDTGQARDKAAEKVNADVSGRGSRSPTVEELARTPLLKNVFAGGRE